MSRNQPSSARRGFLVQSAAAAGVAAASVSAWSQEKSLQEKVMAKRQGQPSADEALRRLVEGNKQYASGKRLVFQLNQGRLAELEKGQHPFATIIGCADSRVPIELVFDQDPGKLFVIRLAGNVIDPDVQGSLEYASVHLGTPLIVVMGHEQCGAVTAALSARAEQEAELPGVRQLLDKIHPAIKNIDHSLPMERQVAMGVEANVRWSMKQIAEHPDHRKAIKTGGITVVGAVYELATGKVRFLKS